MDNSKIYNFIESYGAKCIKLNFALISNFKLNEILDLQDINHFILPIRASKLKIIGHVGNFILENENVEYHIHGTGITFTVNEIKYSFNFEPIKESILPVFSISSLYDYITLVYKKMNHNDFAAIINQLVGKRLLINIHENVLSYYIPQLEFSKNNYQ